MIVCLGNGLLLTSFLFRSSALLLRLRLALFRFGSSFAYITYVHSILYILERLYKDIDQLNFNSIDISLHSIDRSISLYSLWSTPYRSWQTKLAWGTGDAGL